MTTLTDSQLQTVSSMRDQARAGTIGYWQIYAWLADQLDPLKISTDSSVLWLRGATEANANRGAMATLIRVYTQTQYQLRYGTALGDTQMQVASDAVAENMLTDLLGESRDGWPKGQVPDIGRIASADATAVGDTLFKIAGDTPAPPTNSAWSGSLLFSLLRSDQTWRLISTGNTGSVDTLNDVRDVLYAEAAYVQGLKAAQAMFKSESLSQEATDLAIGFKTGLSDWLLGTDTFDSLLAMIKKGAGSGPVGEAFDRIYGAAPYRVMDMILGAKEGKTQIGTTTESNFSSAAKDYFSALSPANMQSTAAQILPGDVAGLVGKATTDVNARAALAALSFVSVQVAQDVADKFKLYNSSTEQGDITEAWIRDRAKMLTAYSLYWRSGRTDNVLGVTLPLGLFLPFPQSGDTVISDTAISSLTVDGVGDEKRYLRFGNGDADNLAGGDKADRLYGGAGDDMLQGRKDDDYLQGDAGADSLDGGEGNDTLFGGAGDDTLEGGKGNDSLMGGAGNDKYRFSTGWGNDVIQDAGGNNTIEVEGIGTIDASTAQKVADGVWQTPDKLVNYTQVDVDSTHKDLIVTFSDRTDTITIRNWGANNDGVSPSDTPADKPVSSNTFNGDYIKKLDPNDPSRYAFDNYGNYANDGAQPGSADLLSGTGNNDIINGLNGNDGLAGFGGDDDMQGGAGDDLMFGGSGRDTLTGGDGKDFIYGSGWGYMNYATKPSDPPPVANGPEYTRGFAWVTYDAGNDANGIHDYQINGAYANTLSGDAGNVIDGGAGDDWIRAGSGDDIVHAGADNDNVDGLAGEDTLYGEAGNDALWGDGIALDGYIETVYGPDQGNDVLVGGAGNDTLVGQGADDELYGGDDNDLILGDDNDARSTPLENHGEDYLDGGTGNDSLIGGGFDDVLFGGSGDDVMQGDDAPNKVDGAYHGDDYLDGEDGADQLVGGGGEDTLFGGKGNDSLWGDDPALDDQYQLADYLDGEEGNDYLDGGGGDDELIGGDGNDTLQGGKGNDALYGDDGADQIGGGEGDDYLDGNLAKDTLAGGDGNDDLSGGADDDKLFGDAGNDYLDGGEGADTVQGGAGDDQMFGDAGNDLMFGEDGADYLDGEDGNDEVQGGGGNDSVYGAAGDDLLVGDEGDDVLAGEAGADQLQGGAGQDDVSGDEGDDVLFGQDGDDTLSGGSGNDQLTGGTGNDVITGDEGADLAWGEAGNDVLDGGAGADQLQGGDDNDTIFGGIDNDVLFGQAGNDSLDGGDGDDYLDGGDGDDVLVGGSGNDTLLGGAGNDTLVGGGGFDYLDAGDGDDTYAFGSGDSDSMALGETIGDTLGQNHLVLNDGQSIGSMAIESSPFTGYSTVNTGHSYVLVKNLLNGSMNDVSVAGTTYAWQEFVGKTLTVPVYANTSTPNQQLVGGKLDDSLTDYGGGSTFWGGTGTDSMVGDGGNNSYVFNRGDGHDTVTEYRRTTPTSTVRFGAGITVDDLVLTTSGGQLNIGLKGSSGDQLSINGYSASNPLASIGIAQFAFADGQTLSYQSVVQRGVVITGTSGDDTLTGSSVSDIFDAGAGNDVLSGKGGADTYLFGRGDGNDLLADQDTAAGTSDRLLFKAGVAASDLLASRYQNDLVLRVGGTSDSVRLKDWFLASSNDRVENIQFDDGRTLSVTDVNAMVALHAGEPIAGQSGNDVLYGTSGNDVMDGAAGNDLLLGDAGNDTLTGGLGNDSMQGGAGSDTYLVGAGSRDDVIDERPGGDATGIDTLHFSDGVSSQSVTFITSGSDLIIRDDARSVSVTVAGQFAATAPANQIERFEFDDGVVMSAADVKTAAQAGSLMSDWIQGVSVDDDIAGGWGHDIIYGGLGNDRLHGDQGNDSLSGDGGNDVLYGDAGFDTLLGGDGNDTLDGGAGRDRLDGGNGDDVYTLGLGTGNDIVVQDASGVDAVQIAGGLTTANVTLYRVSSPPAADIAFNGDSLVIQLNGGSDQLWIANYFASAATGYVERINFSDGTSWDYSAVTAHLASAGGTANTLTGTNKADTFVVDHWNDVLPSTITSGDKAQSSVSYRLPGVGLASFTLTGSLNLFAVPASQGYATYGNTGDNYFESVDRFDKAPYNGGKGNDVYVTRTNADDVTTGMDPASLGIKPTELSGEGSDTLMSGYWSAQLTANVENLVLIAPNAVSNYNLTFNGYQQNDFTHKLIGNALDNAIDATLYEDKLYSQWWYSYRSNPLLGAGTFRMDGGAGADTMIGGMGDDIYVIDNAGDTVVETGYAKAGYDYSSDTVETVFSASLAQYPHIENITLTGIATTTATGNAGSNRLDGSLNSAANVLTGGAGNDTYVVGAADTVVEQAGEGADTVVVATAFASLVRLTDYANTENLRFAGNAGNVDGQGDANANVLTGSLGNNRLSAGDGDDTLYDQFSSDTLTYYGQLAAGDGDTLEGGAGSDALTSYGGNDVLDGGAGDDYLRVYGRVAAYNSLQASAVTVRFGVGDGHDTLTRSNDSLNAYAVEFKPGVTLADLQLAASGDALVSTLSDGSSLTLYGAMAPGSTTQLASGFTLSMTFADGVKLGATQLQALLRTTDHSTATDSDDILVGGSGADVISALGGNDLVVAADGNDLVDGGSGNDAICAGNGADTLTGGTGNDTLGGGNGADVYRFSRGFGQDSIDDLMSASADDGAVDMVQFDSSIAVADVAVYRQVNGSTPVGLVLGVAASGDSVDLTRSYNAGTAGAIELVRFADGTQWDLATMKARIAGEVGSDTNDSLNGTGGADFLDGRGGADTMTGLGGDDTYGVDNAGDQVVEASSAGTDTVVSSIDYTLAANVEKLRMAGSASLRGTGNTLNNTLTGNAGNNRLDGGTGSDTMAGGLGDDTYVVDVSTDVVTELAGEGTDTVETALSHTLGNNVENLLLTGSSRLTGTGNALDNRLTGNSAANSLSGLAGNDWLDGGAGADSMTGGAGDDTYTVDNSSDKTIESSGGGFDTVQSSLTWTLATEVERLFLTGSSAVNGTGNASNNWLVGNDVVNTLDGSTGSDVLMGRAGNDTLQDTSGNNALDGGADNDTLKGGTGNDLLAGGLGTDALTLGGGSDVVVFNRGGGIDTVAAPASGTGAGERNDTLSVGKASWSELALSRETNDLLVKLTSTGDALRLKDWYLSSANQTVARLQWVVDSSSEYVPGTADLLRSSRVCVLAFANLVASFDAARAANPSLVDWHPSDTNLLAARIGASDTSAYGGVFAYRQAQDGTLANVGTGASADLAAAGFGSTMQSVAGSGGAGGGVMAQSTMLASTDAAVAALGTAPAESNNLAVSDGGGTTADAAVMLSGADLEADTAAVDAAVSATDTPTSSMVANPTLVDWQLTDARLLPARTSASDGLAYGGHLAYRYAQDGTLALVQYANGTGQLASAGFGSATQDILLGAGMQGQGFSVQAETTDTVDLMTASAALQEDASMPDGSITVALPQVDELQAAPPPSADAMTSVGMPLTSAASLSPVDHRGFQAPVFSLAGGGATAASPETGAGQAGLSKDAKVAIGTDTQRTAAPSGSPIEGSRTRAALATGSSVPAAAQDAGEPRPTQPHDTGATSAATTPVTPVSWSPMDWSRFQALVAEPTAESRTVPPGVLTAAEWAEVDAWSSLQHALGGAGLDAGWATEQETIPRIGMLGIRSGATAPSEGGLQAAVGRLEQVTRLDLATL